MWEGHMKFTEMFTIIEAKWQTVNLGCVSKHTPVSVQTGLKTVAPIPLTNITKFLLIIALTNQAK